MAFLKAVESNTSPAYDITCDRPDDSIIVLTSTTVTMKLYRNGTQVNSGHESCTIVDGTNGIMSWQPRTGDLSSGAGTYFGDVKVTNADSTFEILFSKFKLKTRDTLG